MKHCFVKEITCLVQMTADIYFLFLRFASKVASRPKLPTAWPSKIDPQTLTESVSRKASLKIKNNR